MDRNKYTKSRIFKWRVTFDFLRRLTLIQCLPLDAFRGERPHKFSFVLNRFWRYFPIYYCFTIRYKTFEKHLNSEKCTKINLFSFRNTHYSIRMKSYLFRLAEILFSSNNILR